jgi:hypothetical protein
MVGELITSLAFLESEMISRDPVIAAAHNIANSVTEISHLRNAIIEDASRVAAQSSRVVTGLAVAESRIRGAVDALRGELPLVRDVCALTPLIARYPASMQEAVQAVIACIESRTSRPDDLIVGSRAGVWKVGAKRAVSTAGIALNFLAARVEVSIPRIMFSASAIISALDSWGKKVKVDDHVTIELCLETRDWILAAIAPAAPIAAATGTTTAVLLSTSTDPPMIDHKDVTVEVMIGTTVEAMKQRATEI